MNAAKTIPGTRSLDELQKQYSGAGKPGQKGGAKGGDQKKPAKKKTIRNVHKKKG